ncbi:methenyltetrahydromethanopterin cyclohydrolase [Desulfosporosinus sp. BICA1-9]|uniref:methenyltetrahydromethanopterin cyclohydrolase n=1 Tax=Desulfosporosinus sp. BICA1-9 TaxID=1531958 RepID=UPI000A6669E7|nr:methenyltetrahydromethanopterin cyclohydrolase [Desulfosporosinus sp. BICA1-9]
MTFSKLPYLSPNRQALPLVKELIARRELLRIEVHLHNGVTVIDCGVHVQGGWDAGRLFAAVCLGGLAHVNLHWLDFNGLRWPAVEVLTDHPVRACLASQYAGWPVKIGNSVALGSGPGRAIIHKGTLFDTMGYEDHSQTAILCLESELLPSEDIVLQLIRRV